MHFYLGAIASVFVDVRLLVNTCECVSVHAAGNYDFHLLYDRCD